MTISFLAVYFPRPAINLFDGRKLCPVTVHPLLSLLFRHHQNEMEELQ